MRLIPVIQWLFIVGVVTGAMLYLLGTQQYYYCVDRITVSGEYITKSPYCYGRY